LVDEFERAFSSGIFGAFRAPGLMLLEASLDVGSDAGVERAVAAAEDVEEPGGRGHGRRCSHGGTERRRGAEGFLRREPRERKEIEGAVTWPDEIFVNEDGPALPVEARVTRRGGKSGSRGRAEVGSQGVARGDTLVARRRRETFEEACRGDDAVGLEGCFRLEP